MVSVSDFLKMNHHRKLTSQQIKTLKQIDKMFNDVHLYNYERKIPERIGSNIEATAEFISYGIVESKFTLTF